MDRRWWARLLTALAGLALLACAPALGQTASDALNQAASESLAQTASDVLGQAASESSDQAASESLAQTASDILGQAASESLAQTASESLAQTASESSAQTASESSDQTASDILDQAASESSDQAASDALNQAASDVLGQEASDALDQAAGESSDQTASDVLGQAASDVEMNERLTVPGDGQIHVYNFSPTANNVYTFRSFGEGQATAWLYLAGETEPIAQGEGFSFQARLIADATYQLQVQCGEGQVEVEMMRAALGRCFEQPIQLTDLEAGYAKAIARAYDTHWYRFTAPVSGTYSIRTHSRVNTVGYLLDEAGRQLAVSDDLYNNYCLDFRIEYQLEAGKSYILRVSARGSETGRYDLAIAVPQEGQVLPESCSVDQERVSLQEGQQVSLDYQVQPQGAMDDVVWVSANPRVATVDQNGLVTARSAGQAQIILAAMNGAQARCLVEVTPIPVTGLTVESASYTMYQGDTLTIPYQVEPADASSKAVIITSSDSQVVSVQSRGMLVAQEPGQAQITLSTIDGGYSCQVEVTVERAPSQYRALVMGMQRFDDGDYRLGAVNTTQGMYDLFSRQNYQSGKAQVTMRLDLTRAQAVSAIRSAFAQAKENDVSILYINTHGGLTGRTPWIKFSDGALLTAAQLEKELSKVKGTVVLLLDCCQSGAFISTATQRVFGTRFIQAFAAGSSGRLTSSKYRILASTSAAQDSFRLLPTQDATESNSSTAFSRSLCEAGGWDLMGDKRTALRADINQDQAVTLYEAYLYCSQRVNKYLENTSQTQDVQMYPMGSQFTLFHTG